jgi:branched-subunit amino acid aminotransferase/4-amino-4-deoxychorismate lyase
VDGSCETEIGGMVPALDRGLLYGEGLFETVRLETGRPFRLGAHLDRLQASAEHLQVPLPAAGWQVRLTRALQRLTRAARIGAGRARITLTAGDADPGGDPAVPPEGPGRLILSVHALGGAPPTVAEIVAIFAGPPVAGGGGGLTQHKTLSYLGNLLCLREARRAGADEGLVRTATDGLVGAARGNLFLVRDGCLLTPGAASGRFPGLVRRLVLEEIAPALGLAGREADLTTSDLATAEEAFLTNSISGVIPLRQAGSRTWRGSSHGSVTTTIINTYRAILARECGTQ